MELVREIYAALLKWLRAPSIADILLSQQESQASQIEALASAMAATAGVMQGFLKGFEVSSPPTPRVTRDSDMYKAEMARLGIPVELLNDPRVQNAALLRMTSDEDSAYAADDLAFAFPPSR